MTGEPNERRPGAEDDTVLATPARGVGTADPMATTEVPQAGHARTHAFGAAEPTVLGRFTELRRVGMGGMGIVFAAHDSMLDRKVALKILRPHRNASEHSLRMIREAQAMARLIHPNVVAVHDVGIIDGCVFLAMDYIEGETFRSLDLGPRQWRRVLEIYMQAGQGLAAAHEAQLVHRDFKPDNVMIGVDGRVRVLDFGLARANHDGPDEIDQATRESARAARRSSALENPLTESGAILGTPAYMAPEQFLGREADALSDQFSFCVALYEQLYAQRPFFGEDTFTLSDNVIHGKLREPPAKARAPRRVFTALRRGLSPSPESRWPSMLALLAELERSLGRGRSWRWVALPLTAIVSVGVYSLLGGSVAPSEACSDPSRLLAGVWDEDMRATVRTALGAVGTPFAEDTAARVEKQLDEYAAALAKTYSRSCAATYERGEQPIRTHELKAECIEERRDELKALVQVLAGADSSIVSNALEASAQLSSLSACDDPHALEERQELRGDPARAAAVQRLRSRLAEVKSLEALGRAREGLAIAADVLAEARELRASRVEVLALSSLGSLHETLGEYSEAKKTMSDAFFAAQSARMDLLAIYAAAALVRIHQAQSAIPEGLVWVRHGEAVVRRTGAGTPEHAELLNSVGVIDVATGRYDEAQAAFEEALAIEARQPQPDELSSSAILLNLGNLSLRQGRFELGEQHLSRAREVYLRIFGPDHPNVAIVDNNLGEILLAKHDLAGARVHYERALELMQRTIGDEHPNMGVPLTNLGVVHLRLGDHAQARTYLTRGLDLFTRLLGEDHAFIAYPLTGLGELELAEGHYDVAIGQLTRALRMRESLQAPPEEVAQTQFALARALWVVEARRAEAVTLARAAEQRFAGAGGGYARSGEEVRAWLAEQAVP